MRDHPRSRRAVVQMRSRLARRRASRATNRTVEALLLGLLALPASGRPAQAPSHAELEVASDGGGFVARVRRSGEVEVREAASGRISWSAKDFALPATFDCRLSSDGKAL